MPFKTILSNRQMGQYAEGESGALSSFYWRTNFASFQGVGNLAQRKQLVNNYPNLSPRAVRPNTHTQPGTPSDHGALFRISKRPKALSSSFAVNPISFSSKQEGTLKTEVLIWPTRKYELITRSSRSGFRISVREVVEGQRLSISNILYRRPHGSS